MREPAVLMIAGRDPQRYIDCAHCRYVRIHAHAAVRAGYDVHILCLDRSERREATAYGTLQAFGTRSSFVRQNMIITHSRPLVVGALELASKLKPSSVIVHGFGVWGHTAAKISEKLKVQGIPSVTLVSSYTTYYDEHTSLWRGLTSEDDLGFRARTAIELAWVRSVVNRYEASGYRRADRILVNYRSVKNMIERRFGAELECEIIPYTVEQEFQNNSYAIRPSRKYDGAAQNIVSIARHSPRKGIDILLKAMHSVKQLGIAFSGHLIGGGPLLAHHCKLLSRLGLSDCVTIHGIVPDVDDFLQRADIFVLPSREEQSGSLALLEAMRSGVACVASSCDGIPEDVTHLHDCWLTTPGDAASLAQGISALIKDPSLRFRLAANGQDTFNQRFSRKAFVEALNGVYLRSAIGA
jgi:glycosyltransferase involved in cell wall biosynthesis